METIQGSFQWWNKNCEDVTRNFKLFPCHFLDSLSVYWIWSWYSLFVNNFSKDVCNINFEIFCIFIVVDIKNIWAYLSWFLFLIQIQCPPEDAAPNSVSQNTLSSIIYLVSLAW